MDITHFLCLTLLLNFHSLIIQGSEISSAIETEKKKLQTYIVHVEQPEVGVLGQENRDVESWHKSFLPFSTARSDTRPRMVYPYKNVISGFAARLTEEELQAMRMKKGFISAHPQRMLCTQTTHTPNFLALQQELGIWKQSNFGKGVIIGVLDTGVLRSHPSFSDEGMPPPPAKWKGRCDFTAFNNKLIGARSSFNIDGKMTKGMGVEPPIDEDGHGTHTASMAAGQFVNYADVLGNAKGTDVGMATLAHLAIYKVCFGEDCGDSNILAAVDAAIEDGVNVLSLSLGADAVPFFQDNIAIGAFAAMKNGIFVSCSAGNSGPSNNTLSNEAPWLLTVGPSTIDQKIVATAKLGNGEEFDGESVFQPNDFLPCCYHLFMPA